MSTTEHIDPQSEHNRESGVGTGSRHAKPSPKTHSQKAAFIASDRLLFAKIAASDEAAFESIFDKYTLILYPYLVDLTKNEADAKEIIQEIFLKCWIKRETLADIENPGGWLYTIAANEAYLHFRKEATYSQHIKILTEETTPDLDDIHEASDSREVRTLIQEAVGQLPLRRRQIFQMSRLEGYSRKEIAETLGISENTVRNQLADAVASIQDYIIKHKSLYLPVVLVTLLGGI